MRRDTRDYVLEWLKREIPEGVARELRVSLQKNRAVSVIGPRRAGKTYYFYQLMKEERGDSLYLNFEDTRLMEVSFREMRDLVRIYFELTGKQPLNLFLDEVQNVERWEVAVRELLDLGRYRIFITGSSSKLLGREIATQLRGRTLSYLLLPFSFREYLLAKGVPPSDRLTADEEAGLRKLLRDYLEFGGFPEVVLEERERDRILKEYLDLILFRDILERHRIKNIGLARFILSFMLQNFSGEISIRKLFRSFELGPVGKNTVYEYVDKVQDSVAIFFLSRFSTRVRVRESWPKKVYLCDTGLARLARFSEDLGKLMENCVFLELLRRANEDPLLEIYYWKDQQGEVDFLLKREGRVEQLIQVTYASRREEVENREVRALLRASTHTGCRELLLLTWGAEDRIEVEGRSILFLPLWKWLLRKGSGNPGDPGPTFPFK